MVQCNKREEPMKSLQTLIKMFRHHPKWIIDVAQSSAYDDEGVKLNGKITFQAKRWHSGGLYYDLVADFETLVEAGNFIANYNQYPVDFEEINKP